VYIDRREVFIDHEYIIKNLTEGMPLYKQVYSTCTGKAPRCIQL